MCHTWGHAPCSDVTAGVNESAGTSAIRAPSGSQRPWISHRPPARPGSSAKGRVCEIIPLRASSVSSPTACSYSSSLASLSRCWQSRGQSELGASRTSQMTAARLFRFLFGRWRSSSQTRNFYPPNTNSSLRHRLIWADLWLLEASCTFLWCHRGSSSSSSRGRGSLVPCRDDSACQLMNGPQVKSRTSGRCGACLNHSCPLRHHLGSAGGASSSSSLPWCDPACPRAPPCRRKSRQVNDWQLELRQQLTE